MVEFSRTFSMSSFECARQIRIRRKLNSNHTIEQIVEIIRTVDPEGNTYDFEAAITLETSLVPDCVIEDALAFYRECIDASMRKHRPIWVKTITYGRKFVSKLSRDEQQCFEASGLLADPASDEVVEWWARTDQTARVINNSIWNAQARAAERLSLKHESERMAKLGIAGQPKWIALEDNQKGFDIQSFDVGAHNPVARVIEVKSTIASPMRFFVTRNEWEVCIKMGEAYHFHIWDMNTETLYEKTGSEIEPHIPSDRGKGRWANTEIKLGSI